MSSEAHSSQLKEAASASGNEDLLRAIIASALDSIIVMDSDGCVKEFNPAAERTFGFSRAEAIGREMAELIIPHRLRERHRNGVVRAVATGRDTIAGHRIEITAIRKDGSEFPVELAITRIATSVPPLFAGHIRDITVRRRAERLQATQLAVTQLLATAATLVEVTPKILCAICEGLGWDFGAIWRLVGDRLSCVDFWKATDPALAEFESATVGGSFRSGEGLPGRVLASGETVWISDISKDDNFPRLEFAAHCDLHSAFAFPIRLGEKVLGVFEFFSRQKRERNPDLLDIFAAIGAQLGQFIERHRAEEDIRLLNVDLERRIEERTSELAAANLRLVDTLERERELSRLKSSFVATVSHEFRTPLGIILSASELLGRYFDKLDAAERTAQLTGIDAAVRRMSALMEQVLTFSHVESGRIECHPEPFNLAGFCTELRDELLSATARRCPIELNFVTPLEGAVGDERLLRHVLTNVITNAVKYSHAGKSVRVNVRREGPAAIITVADDGVGIPAADVQRLFEPFQRGCNVSDLPGTGLGLVIVKKCLDAHGGSLELDSVEGVGTTARVTLPLFPERNP